MRSAEKSGSGSSTWRMKVSTYSPPASDSQPVRMSSNSRCHSFQMPWLYLIWMRPISAKCTPL